MALSSDGNTALIGGPGDAAGFGAAWVFTHANGAWTQQGEKLTGSEEGGYPPQSNFGYSVALSSEGNTALIGGWRDGYRVGAAWVFARANGKWTQHGGKLTGSEEEIGEGEFGYSVALSSGGATALIGGDEDSKGVGAAWVFQNGPAPPTVETGSASDVRTTSATLNATVNPNGEEVSNCRFEYSTTYIYWSSASCSSLPGSGESPVAVSAPVAGLSANTTYYFRIAATNALGTTYGTILAFRTLAHEAEYGMCVVQKLGKYTEGNCLTKHGKGKPRGTYEWAAGPAPTCVAVKKGFYSESGCKTRDERHGKPKGRYEREPGPGYTSTTGTVTLETPGLGGSKVVCAASTGAGEITGVKTDVDRVTFTSCETSGKQCTSEGPNSTPSGKAGVIITNLLDTSLVGPLVSGEVWTEFVSSEHKPYWFEFGCEGPLFRTIGSLSGLQTGNVNVSSLTSTTTFAIGEGEQALSTELSETGGVSWVGPDASSEVTVASNTSASNTEIKP